ncbi:MAG: CHASE domain-containing protein [Pseudomonadota bacterium]
MFGKKNLFAPRKPVWWFGVLLALAVGLLFYLATSKWIEHDSRERFKNLARTGQYSINARIHSYINLLRGTASLFHATNDLSRKQFHNYVAGLELDKYFPAIEVVNFARYVPHQERAALEAEMRRADQNGRDGYPPFAITPPGVRDDYLVLLFIEPLARSAGRYGTDMKINSLIAQGMEESRDSGQISNSGQAVRLPTHLHTLALAMRLPIYRNGMTLDSVAQRRAAFLGSVGVGFSVEALVRGVLDELPVRNVRLTLYDAGKKNAATGAATGAATDTAAETQLYDSAIGPARATRWAGLSEDQSFSTTSVIEFNERIWHARFTVDKRELYSGFDAYFPRLAMAAGTVGTLLIYALFFTLSSSRTRAIHMAQAMTQELRDSQIRLQISHQKLRRLAAHADQIKEEERKRIAREIHDDLGQNLLVLRIDADMLASRTSGRHPRLHARVRATVGQIDATIKSVRHIINDLRPTVLDLGLNAAVEWQIAEFRRRTGIMCELNDHHSEIRINDHCATAFFRILQESLSNISQHAQASLVQVELHKAGSTLSMTVRDNGVGVDFKERTKAGSFGLVGIEERIKILGGHFSIKSGPGAGLTIHVSAPVEASPGADSYLDNSLKGARQPGA